MNTRKLKERFDDSVTEIVSHGKSLFAAVIIATFLLGFAFSCIVS